MSDTSVIKLLDNPRYIQRLADNLAGFKGMRRLGYVTWLKSIGLEVQYK